MAGTLESFGAAALLGGRSAALGGALSPAATDLGHMLPIHADFFAPLASRLACLIGRKFVCFSLLMSRPTSFSGNLFLPFGVH
jgi:hypothetical protein